ALRIAAAERDRERRERVAEEGPRQRGLPQYLEGERHLEERCPRPAEALRQAEPDEADLGRRAPELRVEARRRLEEPAPLRRRARARREVAQRRLEELLLVREPEVHQKISCSSVRNTDEAARSMKVRSSSSSRLPAASAASEEEPIASSESNQTSVM